MCANGVDLGHVCRLCGKPLLSCWDDGPSISWHADEADGRACRLVYRGGETRNNNTQERNVGDD